MSKELEIFREKPDPYNAALALQLGEEYKQLYIGIESVRVVLPYRGATSKEINKTR